MITKIGADVSEKGHYLLSSDKLYAVSKHLKAGEDEIVKAILLDCSSRHESNEDGSVTFYYKKPDPNTIKQQFDLFSKNVEAYERKLNNHSLSNEDRISYQQATNRYKAVIRVLEKLIQQGKQNEFVTEHDLALIRFMR
jgi:hypothetical protein